MSGRVGRPSLRGPVGGDAPVLRVRVRPETMAVLRAAADARRVTLAALVREILVAAVDLHLLFLLDDLAPGPRQPGESWAAAASDVAWQEDRSAVMGELPEVAPPWELGDWRR